jgi:hypothetical protein
MLRNILYALFAIIIIAFIGVMLSMVIPYFPYTRGMHFLSTKTDRVLNNNFYLVNFYIHITSSFVCLIGGLFQFVPQFIRANSSLHKIIGLTYIGSILLLAAPSGLVIATEANGGFAAKVGFVLQCLVWFTITALAFYKAYTKQWLAHTQLMILSYAITLAAFSLRTEGYLLNLFFHTKPMETYVAITWLSWVGNLLIGLVIISTSLPNRLIKAAYRK